MLQLALPIWAIFSLSLLIPYCIAYTPLSDGTLKSLPNPGTDFDIDDGALLAPILRPRVPGTRGSEKVRQHFIDFFQDNLPKWKLELHNSTSETPISGGDEMLFVNMIATRDPPRSKSGEVSRLVLVAHYDSKLEPEGFIGATDSAAPCAMLLHIARSLDEALTRMWEENIGVDGDGLDADKGIQILFTDGEEAFERWSKRDSLYGARTLAQFWEQSLNPAMSTYHNELSSISLFLLLDLLGAENPKVSSYFRTTHWAYQLMGKLEKRLRSLRQFKSSPNYPSQNSDDDDDDDKEKEKKVKEPQWLIDTDKDKQRFGSGIEDDHVPFMERGVEILHIIPSPFPRVWHKMSDNGKNLDIDIVEDWAMLVTAFVAEWMDLEDFLSSTARSVVKISSEERTEKEKEKEKEKSGKKAKRSITSKTEL